MNTGVMLYDRSTLKALDKYEIIAARELLNARFPHQTLAYYLLKKHSVKMFKMDKRFNYSDPFGIDKRMVDGELTPLKEAYICHMTGAWGLHRNDLIRKSSRG